MVMVIDSFQGKYRFLSNFYPSPILYKGVRYPTVEHGYQASKATNLHDRKTISLLPTPGMAKRAAKNFQIRNDWEKVKLLVMEDLLRLKFAFHADLRNKLLATGDWELIEGNWWGDTFWGVCNNEGENHLGKLLMKIRSEKIILENKNHTK